MAFILFRMYWCYDIEHLGVMRYKCGLLELTVTPQVNCTCVQHLALQHSHLTSCSQVMLEKLIVFQLVKIFSTFYGLCHSSVSHFLSLQRPIQSKAQQHACLIMWLLLHSQRPPQTQCVICCGFTAVGAPHCLSQKVIVHLGLSEQRVTSQTMHKNNSSPEYLV